MSTGNALATITDPAPKHVAHLSGGAVQALVPQTFDDVWRFSQVLSRSGLTPYGMSTAEQVSVAILTGLELGIKPMQAVQGIAVINGRPCVWGDLALAVVRSSGQLEYIKEKFEGTPPGTLEDWAKPTGEMLQFRAVCIVKRKGDPEEVISEFSISDAIVAKLWNKRGHSGKDTPWITNPKRMLKMRARGFALRDTFTESLKGVGIAEEQQDVEAEERAALPEPPAPPPEDEPVQAAPAPTPPPSAGEGERIEEAQFSEAAPAPEAAAAEADAEQDQPFDAEAWLDEVRGVFAGCRSSTEVDEAHAMFEDTATDLPSIEAQKYEDIHDAAAKRVAEVQGQPEQAEVTGEPGPAPQEQDDDDSIPAASPAPPSRGQAYLDRLNHSLKQFEKDPAALHRIWEGSKDERKLLVSQGELSAEKRDDLRNRFVAAIAAAQQGGEQTAAEKPRPGAAAPPAGTAPEVAAAAIPEGDTINAYDRDLRAALANAKTGQDINKFWIPSVARRNALRASEEQVDAWKADVQARRDQLNGTT